MLAAIESVREAIVEECVRLGRPVPVFDDRQILAALEQSRLTPGGSLQLSSGPHGYSSTQFNLADAGYARSQGSPLSALQAMAREIAEEDLAGDGREEELHVTVLYGLHTDYPAEVWKVAEAFGSVVVVKLGKTSLFEVRKPGKSYDVVKVDVESPDLHRLHSMIAEALPHTDTHPVYHPHITLAYVQPGQGLKYAGNPAVEGMEICLSRLIFSDREGGRSSFRLRNRPASTRLSQDDPDRSPIESASSIVDAIIDRGAAAGVTVADEIRRKVKAQLKKKFGRKSG